MVWKKKNQWISLGPNRCSHESVIPFYLCSTLCSLLGSSFVKIVIHPCSWWTNMQHTLTLPLGRYAAFHIFILCRILCLYHPPGTDLSSWNKKKKKKKHEWDRDAQQWCIYKHKSSTNNHNEAQCSPSRTDTQLQTDTHKYTEEWQRCDRPWMITSWPSGPSPQISLSGSKSGLSLYANQPPFNPTNHSPPHWQPLPITALWLTMPSKINIKLSRRQKRSDITENRRGTGCVEY